MSFSNNDIVKFDGNDEPCTIYRVIDSTPQMMENEFFKRICEHIRLEVVGMVPVEVLVHAEGHPKNIFAIDKKLQLTDQTN